MNHELGKISTNWKLYVKATHIILGTASLERYKTSFACDPMFLKLFKVEISDIPRSQSDGLNNVLE